jgi:Putative regulator of cell autolysis
MLKNKFLNHLNNYSIKQQLFIIYIPIILLLTLLIGSLLIFDSTQQLKKNYADLTHSESQRARSIIFEVTNSFTNDVQTLSIDTDLRTILSTDYNSTMEAAEALSNYTYIDRLRNQDASISDITIYTTNPSIGNYQNVLYATKETQKQDWFQRSLIQSDNFWQTHSTEGTRMSALTIYKSIPLPLSTHHAVVKISMDYNFLNNRLKNSRYKNQLFLNHDALFYSSKMSDLGDSPFTSKKLIDSMITNQFLDTPDKPNTLFSTNFLHLRNQQDTIHIYTMDFQAYQNLKNNILKWCSILLLTILGSSMIILIFANLLSSRIQALQKAVYHASIEDYPFFNQISGKDEISIISLDFHKIIQQNIRKNELMYQAQLHEKELLTQQKQMELNILASQINPHFLFNTLETIRMTALKNKDREAANSIKLLSKSMRYTLDNQGSTITTLSQELAAIHVYSDIQKMRFGDRVNLSIQLDSDIQSENIYLLPLLIQPLVENAISHGLEGLTKKGMITISITKDHSYLWIEVMDNGVGISTEKLDELTKQIAKNDLMNTQHIGLRNVNNRIKMYYGEDCGLLIVSSLGLGTRVSLKLNLSKVTKNK